MTKATESKQLEELEQARNTLAEQIEKSQKALVELDKKIASLKAEMQESGSSDQ